MTAFPSYGLRIVWSILAGVNLTVALLAGSHTAMAVQLGLAVCFACAALAPREAR